MPSNRLSKEKSPYLLQHAHNPVDWYPWGEEAFTKAKKENKPVFLSIGYSTCHWCHVMEHESFENEGIAKVLNENFISIKVDREERPDIDHAYMSVVVAITGNGGWPLSVFLTPEKKPFYGGTYFPPLPKWGSPGFKDLLITISDSWKNKKEEILQSSQSLTGLLEEKPSLQNKSGVSLNENTLINAYRQLEGAFDEQHGGFGRSPKFPTGHNLSFLLRYWNKTKEEGALLMVEKTLSSMAKGGVYDHLGGGFHRYSTDEKWHVPHFEKMLYDQATITKAYLEAYQATKNKEYADVVREVFNYCVRDMKEKGGAFFSAEDADSLPSDEDSKSTAEKKEGAFYVWHSIDIEKILGKENAPIFEYRFGVKRNGNAEFDPHGEFIGKNILFAEHSIEETASHFQKSFAEIEKILSRSKEKLFAVREKRPKPHLDDKILVDWNGLMISSLAFGSRVLKEPRYLESAEEAASFILKSLKTPDGRLLHRYRDGEAAIVGTLSDYAFFIQALLDLYEASFKAEYLREAKALAEDMLEFFWDDAGGGFFLSANDAEKILFPQKETYDGAIPSGNSIAALDLIRLGKFTLEDKWEKKAEELFAAFSEEIFNRPSGYTQLLNALDFMLGPSKEIVIAGDATLPQTQEFIEAIFERFIPDKIVLLRPSKEKEVQAIIFLAPFIKEQTALKGKPTTYVCQNHTCQFPATDTLQLIKILDAKE